MRRLKLPTLGEGVVEGVVFFGGALLVCGVLAKLLGCSTDNSPSSNSENNHTRIEFTQHITNLPPSVIKREFYPVPMLHPVVLRAKPGPCLLPELPSLTDCSLVPAAAGCPTRH